MTETVLSRPQMAEGRKKGGAELRGTGHHPALSDKLLATLWMSEGQRQMHVTQDLESSLGPLSDLRLVAGRA